MNGLTFTEQHHRDLHAHLFPGDGLEALAFALATEIESGGRRRLLVNEIFLIPHKLCDRSADYITWNTRDIGYILDKAEQQKKVVVKIHSHPYGPRAFSLQDDRSDAGLFPALFNWCGGRHHVSIVFTPDFIVGRIFDAEGKIDMIDNIWVAGHPLRLFPHRPNATVIGFDESTYHVFHGLKVGVVGDSGTGGWISELFARNEVGVLLNCDGDILKDKNLNRIVNARRSLIGMNKAKLASESVLAMDLGTVVEICDYWLHTKSAIEFFKTCDVIVGCSDSVFARHILSFLCSYYMIPLFDVGVHISAKPGKIVHAAGGFDYFVPGGSSFLTREIFTAADLATETFALRSPGHFNRLKQEGYVRGLQVDRPAVSGINCLSAALCFEEIQARVLNYRNELDHRASRIFCAKSGDLVDRQESSFPIDSTLARKVGRGDDFFKDQGHLLFGDEGGELNEHANIKTTQTTGPA